jgi:hypothetical protein
MPHPRGPTGAVARFHHNSRDLVPGHGLLDRARQALDAPATGNALGGIAGPPTKTHLSHLG